MHEAEVIHELSFWGAIMIALFVVAAASFLLQLFAWRPGRWYARDARRSDERSGPRYRRKVRASSDADRRRDVTSAALGGLLAFF